MIDTWNCRKGSKFWYLALFEKIWPFWRKNQALCSLTIEISACSKPHPVLILFFLKNLKCFVPCVKRWASTFAYFSHRKSMKIFCLVCFDSKSSFFQTKNFHALSVGKVGKNVHKCALMTFTVILLCFIPIFTPFWHCPLI